MIYFLGGPPRIGKSLIAQALSREQKISSVSTDSLGAVLESVLDPAQEPDLFAVNRCNALPLGEQIVLLRDNFSERIKYQLEESSAVWKAVPPYIRREEEEGRDVVIEGVAVLPMLVRQLRGIEYRAVFVGSQGAEHRENIKKSARERPHDWMWNADAEYIDAFARFVVQMSVYLQSEAELHGFKYIEFSAMDFEAAVSVTVQALLEGERI